MFKRWTADFSAFSNPEKAVPSDMPFLLVYLQYLIIAAIVPNKKIGFIVNVPPFSVAYDRLIYVFGGYTYFIIYSFTAKQAEGLNEFAHFRQ